jgi:homoserine dehydrogenase
MHDDIVLPVTEIETSYYLRMRAFDRPGVLAEVTRILADLGISIEAMLQREPEAGEERVDVIMLTHQTIEKQIDQAIAKIETLDSISGPVTRIRLEPLGPA